MHVLAMVVFQGRTNIPEDRFINTFHFDSTEPTLEAAATAIGPVLGTFYGTVAYPNANGVNKYLSDFIARPFAIKYYDMADAEPRVPYTQAFQLPTYNEATGKIDLPDEVAICLSFHAGPPITGRRRGRVFLGPLASTVVNDSSAGVPSRVANGVRTDLATAATNLVNADLGWAIYSRAATTLYPVVGGWIDDAFDTQRRRGTAPSTRTLWAAS